MVGTVPIKRISPCESTDEVWIYHYEDIDTLLRGYGYIYRVAWNIWIGGGIGAEVIPGGWG